MASGWSDSAGRVTRRSAVAQLAGFMGAAGAGSALATGCAPQGEAPATTTAQPKPVQVLIYETSPDDPWAAMVNKLLSEFAARDRRYAPVVSTAPNPGEKMRVLVAAGEGVDVVRDGLADVQSDAPAGVIQPLTPYTKGDASYKPYETETYPSVREVATYQGNLYALSSTLDVGGFFLNRDRLRQGTFNFDKLPATLQDWAQALHPYFQRDGDTLRMIGWIPWIPANFPEPYLAAFGAEWYDAKAERVTTNSPECLQTFEWFKGVADRYGGDAILNFIQQNSANTWGVYTTNSRLWDGTVAAFYQSAWVGARARQYAPKVDFQILALPPAQGAKNARPGVLGMMPWVMPATSKEPKGAWEVLKWMNVSDAGVLGMAQVDGEIPSNRRLATSKAYLDANPWMKVFAEEVAPKGKPQYMFASAGVLRSQLNQAVNRVYQGKMSPKDALDDVVRTVEADIEAKKRK